MAHVASLDYRLEASLLSLADLSRAEEAVKLVEVLEGDPHGAPTHWGKSDSVRNPFEGQALRSWLTKLDPEQGLVPSMRRTRRPRYLLTWSAGRIHPHPIIIESTDPHEPGELSALLDLCDRVAGVIDIDFGVINLMSDEQPESTYMHPDGATPHVTAYIEGGIETLYQRNYIGPRVVGLVGGAQPFRKACAHVRELSNGTLVLDLAADILAATPEELKSAQATLLARLADTGIFEGPGGRPGQLWQPPPGAWSE